MINTPVISLSALLFVTLSCSSCNEQPVAEKYYTIEDYYTVPKYDVHAHINTTAPWFVEQSAKENFYLLSLNVDVAGEYPPVAQQQEYTIQLAENFPGRVAYASSFSIYDFHVADWQQKTLAYLQESFNRGAVAVKVWKNIGMTLRDSSGRFVMIDDPRFDTIIRFIAQNNITLIGHLGEPRNCWLPVKQMTVAGDRNYFTAHPEYHMYLHSEYPSYEEQLKARDRMLDKHSGLIFIGAHLGSLEWDVDAIARQLDKYPNMAVEAAARISHLQHQAVTNHKKVYDFIIKYQDRILYGTDIEVNDRSDTAEALRHIRESRLADWKFFTSADILEAPDVTGKFTGLHLPQTVVDKIYYTNALKWVPGLKQ